MLRVITLLISLGLALFVAGCVVQPIMPEAVTPSATEEAMAEATSAPSEEASPFSAEVLKNLAYTLEFVGSDPVQLTDGVYEDAANRIFVSWVDTYALGQLNGEPVAAVVLQANTGGSGTFTYLVMVQERDGVPVDVTSTLLGDRVKMNWVTIAHDDEIALEVVTQGPDEAMCCGTQRMVASFALDGTQLVETNAQVIGVQPQIMATQVITFVPEIVPEASQAGSCFANAIGLGRADAWRCTTDDNLIHDPCFEMAKEEVGATPTVVCGADPITGMAGFVLELTEPLPAPDPRDASHAWLVQLGDGTFCGLLTGTVPGADGQVAPYGCTDQAHSYLLEEFIFFDPVWYAQSVVFGRGDEGFIIESSVRIPIATVWR